MIAYTQLTQEQRYQISALKKIGSSQKEMAEEIGMHKSTISREVRRNTGARGYRPRQAHEKSLGRRSKTKVQIGAAVWKVERKSRYTLLGPVQRRQADLVRQATVSLLLPFMDRVLTITGDNGKEFAEILKAVFYFAHPYSAWERGTNENTNGLVRQYFPKSTNFSKVTYAQSLSAADKLNHRPRKCLAFRTPFEVFFEHQSVALVT